jgi:hypothetical protein
MTLTLELAPALAAFGFAVLPATVRFRHPKRSHHDMQRQRAYAEVTSPLLSSED